MNVAARRSPVSWVVLGPVLALVVLAFTWGRDLPAAIVAVVGLVLGVAVLAAVHHAEVVAHRVGEPFGSLVLALAVTLLLGGIRFKVTMFNAEGTGAALATVATLATLCLVLPTFTTSRPGPEFSGAQLVFAAIASVILYVAFVLTQTVRHRDFFLPVTSQGVVVTADQHADPPSNRASVTSLGLLLVALIAVVGLAKVESPAIEAGVEAAGLPASFVGVVIALLVLLPETLAASRNALGTGSRPVSTSPSDRRWRASA